MKVHLTHILHIVARLGVHQVVCQHGIPKGSTDLNPIAPHDMQVELQVLADNHQVLALKNRTKLFDQVF